MVWTKGGGGSHGLGTVLRKVPQDTHFGETVSVSSGRAGEGSSRWRNLRLERPWLVCGHKDGWWSEAGVIGKGWESLGTERCVLRSFGRCVGNRS